MSSSTALRNLLSVNPAEKLQDQLPKSYPSQPHQLTDDSVMRGIQSGDRQSLGVLFDRYSRLILSIGSRILRDTSEAQELVQDVFLYVFNKGQSFDPSRSSVRSWLVQIAYSRAFDRRDYLVVRQFYSYCHIDEVIDSIASDFSLENHGQLAEFRDLLQQAFTGLSERQRETLELFFFDGYSLREISAQLDETLGNTRNHYYRGLEKLRELMTLYLAPIKTGKELG